jgi:predicted nucleic acid-binding protein
METLYLETTIVGHLTGRLLTDPIVASRQQLTREWWTQCAGQYDLFISQLVIDECGAGAASAAGERLNVIQSLPLLDATLETDLLAAALIAAKAIPETEPRDAFHISIAATNGVKYLLTWNFKHIANATLRKRIERSPVISRKQRETTITHGLQNWRNKKKRSQRRSKKQPVLGEGNASNRIQSAFAKTSRMRSPERSKQLP